MRLPTRLSQRKAASHKGDFGHVFIVAGSLKYSGAAQLCAEAALRSGAGLVTLGVPKAIAAAMIKTKPKELMLLPLAQTKDCALSLFAFKGIADFSRRADVLLIGPGLGAEASTRSLARKVVSGIALPMVIDADALNAFAGQAGKLPGNSVLTPHPGEMARLLGLKAQKIQADRKKYAKALSRQSGCVVILKGHRSIVAYRDKLYENKTGNPGMATGGSGDVLSGIIGAFIGQGLSLFDAAKYAVYLHGLAGDLAAKDKSEISLIASDIIDKIPQAIKRCS